MTDLLIVVDMQRDFVSGALGSEQARAIVPAVAARIRQAKAEQTQVAFTLDTHEPDYLNTREGRFLPVPHCIRGTDGWKLESSLDATGCPVFEKPGFGSPALIEYLESLPDLTEVEFVGLCTDICVITNAMMLKGALPEVAISVRANACAGVTPGSHETALAAMKMCQIEIL